MLRRRHNEVRILGVVLLLAGILMEFFDGQNSFLRAMSLPSENTSPREIIIVKGDDDQARFVISQSGVHQRINHNAADDPAFRKTAEDPSGESLWEFLGIYDADLGTAIKVIFLAGGLILLAISFIKPKA